MKTGNHRLLLGACAALLGATLLHGDGAVLWTTAAELMPQWGFYPNGQAYGNTRPVGAQAAWTVGAHALTWIAEFPETGDYHVWIRKVYGRASVTVDGRAPDKPRGGAPEGKYAWRHAGVVRVEKGARHVDIDVRGQSMVDAVLFAASGTFNPEKDPLPEPVGQPSVREPRRYRSDAHLRAFADGKRFIACGGIPLYEEILYDWIPTEEDLRENRVVLWGAANQYVNGTFGIRALENTGKMDVSLSELKGPSGAAIGKEEIDLRVVSVRERTLSLFSWKGKRTIAAELLLRDGRTGVPPKGRQGGYGGGTCTTEVPAGESRQIWMTVRVPPGSPEGRYTGTVALKTAGGVRALPVGMEILPVELRDAEGYYSIFYPVQPNNPERANYVSEERYLAELKDMVRHGLNAATLYGGFRNARLAADAGMKRAPVVMGWPDGGAKRQVEEARAMGFDGLIFWGVDEPGPEAIERVRKEAERRKRMGLGVNMMATMTVTSDRFYEETQDIVNRPVFFLGKYDGKENPVVVKARENGRLPVSYWMTSSSFPLWHRAYAGLYNTACGYQGTMPWSYTDYAAPMRKYDPDEVSHQVTYPDEYGQPIPTLQWEAYRAGIDDVRYLEALRRAVAQGEKRLGEPSPPAGLREAVERARGVRRARFDSIGGRWFLYLCGIRMDDLEGTRREFAESAAAISRLLR